MAVSKIKQDGSGGQHIYNFVPLGAGWNGYPYGFCPLKNADAMTVTLTSVSYYNGGTVVDATSDFSVGNKSQDGFAINNTTSASLVGKSVNVIVSAS